MTGWKVAVWTAVIIAVLAFLYLVRAQLIPFIAAFVISTILEPWVRKLRLRGFSQGMAVVLVMLPFYLLLVAGGVVLTPKIATQVSKLSTEADGLLNSLTKSSENSNYFLRWNPETRDSGSSFDKSLDNFFAQYGTQIKRFGLPSSREEIMTQYIEPQRPKITAALEGAAGGFVGILTSFLHQAFNFFIFLLLVPLFLLNMAQFRRTYPKWIPPSIRSNLVSLLTDVGDVFQKYLRGVSHVLILYVIVIGAYLSIMGVPYGILLAILFSAFYLIPIVGNLLNYSVCFITLMLTQTSSNMFMHLSSPTVFAVVVVGLYICIGVAFDQMIYPQVVGNAVGLNPILSLFVIITGGTLFGLVGMIIAYPIAGAVKIILDRVIRFTTNPKDQLGLPPVPLRHRRA